MNNDNVRKGSWVPFRKAGPYIFISGVSGRNKDGSISGDPVEQIEQTYRNLEETLGQAGAKMSDLVMLTQWYADRKYIPEALRLRHESFVMPFPASMGICSNLSSPEYVIELEGVAYIEP